MENHSGVTGWQEFFSHTSLRSRRLKVVGEKENGPLACLPRARPFSLSPTTSKRLLRKLFSYKSF